MEKEKLLTIVVIAYNEEYILEECLKALENQTLSKKLFDVIIVDNNSTDRTEEIAKGFVSNNNNFSYVFEEKPGISYARNAGAKAVKTEYIAYIDADAKARPSWIEQALKTVSSQEPDILGGPIYPFYVSEKPSWFKDKYEIRMHQKETGWMSSGTYLSASNYILKKSLLEELGWFDVNHGNTGDKITYGEEVKIVFEAHKLDKKIYYDLDLIVEHIVPEFKMSVPFFIFRTYRAGKDAGSIYNDKPSYKELLQMLDRTDKVLLDFENVLKGNYDEELYEYPENYLAEAVIPRLHLVGRYNQHFLKNFTKDTVEYLEYSLRENNTLSIKQYIKSLFILTKIFIKTKLRNNGKK